MTRDEISKRDQAAINQAVSIVLGNHDQLSTRALLVETARLAMLSERSRIRGAGAPDCAVIVLDVNGDEHSRFAIRDDSGDVAGMLADALHSSDYVPCCVCHEFVKESGCDLIDTEESEWCCKPCNTPREPNTATQATQEATT